MTKAQFLNVSLYPLLKKLNFKKTKKLNIKPYNTLSRNALLLPHLLGRTFKVHNGRVFLRVLVSENIIGHKLGEFSQSRRRYFYKKGKKNQKRK